MKGGTRENCSLPPPWSMNMLEFEIALDGFVQSRIERKQKKEGGGKPVSRESTEKG